MSNASTTTTTRERYALNLATLVAVARMYREAVEIPALVGTTYDPNPITRSHRWTPNIAHYKIDVANAVKTLDKHPDRAALLKAWNRLLDQDNEDDAKSRVDPRLVMALGPVFVSRGLNPLFYFRSEKYPQRRAA